MEKYVELEPKITIGKDFRNKIKIQKLENERSEVEKVNESNKNLQSQVDELNKAVNRLIQKDNIRDKTILEN